MNYSKTFLKLVLILTIICSIVCKSSEAADGEIYNHSISSNKQSNSSLSSNVTITITATPTTKTTETIMISTTTEAPPSTTPKLDILTSELCLKCKCQEIVSQIDCDNSSMTTLFLPDTWHLLQYANISFKTIKLQNNQIAHLPQIPTYPVEILNLRFNRIHTISKAAFRNLTKLTELYLGYNRIDDKVLHPDVFLGVFQADKYEPLKNLRTLDLSHNLLTKFDMDVFEHLPDLENLILCSNPFHMIDNATLTAIASLTQLKTLDLSYMDLNTLPKSLFHSLLKLENLLLAGNKFSTLPEALHEAIHLNTLVLDANPLVNFEGDNIFMKLINLKYLRISNLPNIYRIGAGAFSNLPNLTTLIAANNSNLFEIDEMAFAQTTIYEDIFSYPPLEELYLNNNSLQILKREWILRWDQVKVIDLRYNPWSCNCSNEWLIRQLIVHINHSTSHLATSILCALPDQWSNLPLLTLSEDPELQCKSVNNKSQTISFLGIFIGLILGLLITVSLTKLYERYGCTVLNRLRRRDGQLLHNSTTFSEDIYI